MMMLEQLFEISYGTKLDWNKMSIESSGIAFVSRTSKNNGVVGYVEKYKDIEPFPEGLITVSLGGTYVLSAFVQLAPFYTGQNVAVLIPKKEMNICQKLFYCMCITMNRYRYSAFGREANKTLKSLLVPSIDEMPKEYINIKLPDYRKKTECIDSIGEILDIKDWKEYQYNEIFDIKGGYYNKKPDHVVKGNIPFIGATRENNGITELYSEEDISMFHKDGSTKEDDFENKVFLGNCITVINNGASVGYSFYQENDFTCSHDINILYLRDRPLNVKIAMFLIALIEMERYRWNYGRKWRPKRMKESMIKLPSILKNGTYIPDWNYMESVINGCRYSKSLEIK